MNVEDMLKIHIFFILTKYGYIIIYNKKVVMHEKLYNTKFYYYHIKKINNNTGY